MLLNKKSKDELSNQTTLSLPHPPIHFRSSLTLCIFSTPSQHSVNLTQQLCLQDELSLLVLLRLLKSFVILPPHRSLALLAHYVSDNVATCGHGTFTGLTFFDVHDSVEEVGFAMLASEVTRDDVVVIREMGFALCTAVDPATGQINIVRETHCDQDSFVSVRQSPVLVGQSGEFLTSRHE